MCNRGNSSYKPNPRLARVLDIVLILHAEHEMNCSTAAARHLASWYLSLMIRGFIECDNEIYLFFVCSGADVYTVVAGALKALFGPLHGGAVEAVPKMLSEIGTVENIPEFIESVKNR